MRTPTGSIACCLKSWVPPRKVLLVLLEVVRSCSKLLVEPYQLCTERAEWSEHVRLLQGGLQNICLLAKGISGFLDRLRRLPDLIA